MGNKYQGVKCKEMSEDELTEFYKLLNERCAANPINIFFLN